MKIKYWGGPGLWYKVEARGSWGLIGGHRCLHDVMAEVMQVDGWEKAAR